MGRHCKISDSEWITFGVSRAIEMMINRQVENRALQRQIYDIVDNKVYFYMMTIGITGDKVEETEMGESWR